MHTLPLEAEELGRFFEDTETLFEINYAASLKNLGSPLAVLTYIANLGMTCALLGDLDDDLIVEYLTLKSLTDIKNLQLIHANILHFGKYGTRLYPLDQFEDEQTQAFCKKHERVIQFQMAFINSTQLYLYCSTFDEPLKQNARVTKESFNELGFSILRLFSLMDFMVIYMAENPPLEDQIYFERYFDEKVFNGAPMMVYFHHPNNLYAGLVKTTIEQGDDKLHALNEEWEKLADLTRQAISDDPSLLDQDPENSTL